MKIWKKVIIVLVILMSMAVVPVMVEAGNGANRGTKTPYNFREWVPCANGGVGEHVNFTGFEHWFRQITHDKNGGRHVKVHISHHLTGTGEITDDFYRMADVGNDYFLFFPPDENGTAHAHVKTLVLTRPIIGKGQAVNGFVHETRHYTMNANGEVTVDFIKRNITCK